MSLIAVVLLVDAMVSGRLRMAAVALSFQVATVTELLSVVAHGVTARPLIDRYLRLSVPD